MILTGLTYCIKVQSVSEHGEDYRREETEGLTSLITLNSLGPWRKTSMTLCKQQGACVSHNVPNPHSNPNRITLAIEFKLELWVTFTGYSLWNVLWVELRGSRVDKMESGETNGKMEARAGQADRLGFGLKMVEPTENRSMGLKQLHL